MIMRCARVAVVALLPLSIALSQSLYLGVQGGTTSATQHETTGRGYEAVHRLSGGVTASVEFTRWLAVQAEALYAQKGSRSGEFYEVRLDYVEVPLMVRLSTPFELAGLRAFVTGGGAGAWERGCSGWNALTLDLWPGAPVTVLQGCPTQRQKRGDLSLVSGMGLAYHAGSQLLSVEIRHTSGISSISGYSCCSLRNDATSVLVGASVKLR
jgi:hypothetical protein